METDMPERIWAKPPVWAAQTVSHGGWSNEADTGTEYILAPQWVSVEDRPIPLVDTIDIYTGCLSETMSQGDPRVVSGVWLPQRFEEDLGGGEWLHCEGNHHNCHVIHRSIVSHWRRQPAPPQTKE